jgi:tetratricopeptide (TPR) repeat protein
MSWALLGRILGKKEPEEIERAEEHILKGIQILEELKAKPLISQGYFYLGELYADAGKKDEAMNHLKKAEKMFQEMGMDYYLAKTKEVLEQV